MVGEDKHELQPVVLEGLLKHATEELIKFKGKAEIRTQYLKLQKSLDQWRSIIEKEIKDESDIVLPYLVRMEHWLNTFLK